MDPFQNILDIIKRKKVVFFVFVLFQVLMIFFTRHFFVMFSQAMENLPSFFEYIFLFLELIIFIIIDVIQIINICKVKSLVNVQPIKCTIEDFIITSYVDDDKRRYRLNPVVKSGVDNKLYFTFGSYCLLGYNSKYAQLNNSLRSMYIYRKDKSKVEIGDIAYLYIRKNKEVNVKINPEKNIVKLNNKKLYFNNINEAYDINLFNELNYFEGIIDVENNQ